MVVEKSQKEAPRRNITRRGVGQQQQQKQQQQEQPRQDAARKRDKNSIKLNSILPLVSSTPTKIVAPPSAPQSGNALHLKLSSAAADASTAAKLAFSSSTTNLLDIMQLRGTDRGHATSSSSTRKQRKGKGRMFDVQIPKRMLNYVVLVFVVLPLFAFLYKELHPSKIEDHAHFKPERFHGDSSTTNEVLSHLLYDHSGGSNLQSQEQMSTQVDASNQTASATTAPLDKQDPQMPDDGDNKPFGITMLGDDSKMVGIIDSGNVVTGNITHSDTDAVAAEGIAQTDGKEYIPVDDNDNIGISKENGSTTESTGSEPTRRRR